MQQRIYTYDARVKNADGGEQFVLEVATALRRGDLVECDKGNFTVQYVVQARAHASLPMVLLTKL